MVQDQTGPRPLLHQPSEMYNEYVNVRLNIAARDLVQEAGKEISDEMSDSEMYADQLTNVSVLGRFDALSSLTHLTCAFTDRANKLREIMMAPNVDGTFRLFIFRATSSYRLRAPPLAPTSIIVSHCRLKSRRETPS
jgi:hypothetical protein